MIISLALLPVLLQASHTWPIHYIAGVLQGCILEPIYTDQFTITSASWGRGQGSPKLRGISLADTNHSPPENTTPENKTKSAGISLGMHPADEGRSYNVTTALIGWVHT